MLRAKLESSAIQEVIYDENSRLLTVVFHHGGAYDYPDVPKEKVLGLIHADSCGKYFHREIRQYSKLS